MQDVVPTPIVAKVEADSRIGAACARMAKDALTALAHGARGDLARIEIARRVCALALDPHARQEAKDTEERRRRQDGYPGGRPYTVHGLAFEALRKETGISEKTCKRWLVMWNKVASALELQKDDAELAYVTDTTVNELMRGVRAINGPVTPPTLEAWLEDVLHPKEEEKSNDEHIDPRVLAVRAAKKALSPFLTVDGKIKLLPAAYRAWRAEIEKIVVAHGDKILTKQATRASR
jgi:hypothetical protein